MTRTTRALLGAALIAGAAAPVGAQTFDFGTICGSENGATSCATVSGQVFTGYLEVRVQNAEGLGLPGDVSRITGVGIYYFGTPSMGPMGELDETAGVVPGGGWTDGFGNGGGALDNPGPQGSEFWLVAASADGGIWGCTDPTGNSKDVGSCAGPLTFRFNFTGPDGTNLIQAGRLEFAFRAQSVGPNGESTKCYTSDAATSAKACAPFITTPEPATVVLMASGLLGVFGITLRRRSET